MAKKAVKKALKKGDKVEWSTPQGKTSGTVKKKLTSTTKVKGHTAKATKKDPEYLVESDKTGKKAAHKAEALKKAKPAKKTAKWVGPGSGTPRPTTAPPMPSQ